MRGNVFFLLSVLFCTLYLIVPTVSAAEHKEYTENHTFDSEVLEELIEVWAENDDYDHNEAQAMIDRIGNIPERILKNTLNHHAKLLLIDFPLVELDEYAHLKGEVPRGWEGLGYTWDDVPGAGGQTAVARIGMSNPNEVHGSMNLELHEFGHTIDQYVTNYPLTTSNSFLDIYTQEKEALFGDDPYFDIPEEYFAEALSYYYIGGSYKEELKNKAPKTFDFFDHLEDSLLTVERSDETGVELSWEKIADAHQYDIYRDEEKIAEVDEAAFIDDDFLDNTIHLYRVEAMDDAGEPLHLTFDEEVLTEELAKMEAPVKLKGKVENESILLNWKAPDEAVEFDVIRDEEIIETISEIPYTDEEVREGSTYEYKIVARDDKGMSAESAPIKVTMEKDDVKEEKTNSSSNLIYILVGVGLILIITILVLRKKKK